MVPDEASSSMKFSPKIIILNFLKSNICFKLIAKLVCHCHVRSKSQKLELVTKVLNFLK